MSDRPRCSFCDEAIPRMFAARDAYICEPCVYLFADFADAKHGPRAAPALIASEDRRASAEYDRDLLRLLLAEKPTPMEEWMEDVRRNEVREHRANMKNLALWAENERLRLLLAERS